MKIYFTFALSVVLTSCASNEQRIADFQGRCKLIGYEANSEGGKACVLELEKQYVVATSSHRPINTNSNTNVNSSASINTNSSTKKDACVFNSSNSRYETCYHVAADGTCVHYGSICTP